MKLYTYWRSSSSWRVRIALHHKNVAFESVPVQLLTGEQFTDEHRARSPMGKVPALEIAKGVHLAESMAILEWLEETYPEPALLPKDPLRRARARMLAEMVNSGIQPFQNTSVTRYVREIMTADDKVWVKHWLATGLTALEHAMRETAGKYALGDELTLADVLLVPQLYGARRFEVDLSHMPTLVAVERACAALPAFQAAHPDSQADKPAT